MAPTVSSIKINNNTQTLSTNKVDKLPSVLANTNGSSSNTSIQNNNQQNFQEELKKLSKQYNISLEELIKTANNGLKIYAKRHNTKVETIDNISVEGQIRTIRFLKNKLNEYKTEKNIDIKNTEINGDKFREFLKDKNRQKEFESAKDGLAVFLINNKLLKLPKDKDIKTVTLRDIPKDELKQAVSTFIKNAVNGINNSQGDKSKIKAQMKHFEILLRGTNDSDIDVFWDSVKDVMSEDDSVKDCITLLVKNINSSEAMTKFIAKISAEDLNKLGLSKDELATAMRNVGNDPEAIEKVLNAYFQLTENGIKVERAIREYKSKNNIAEGETLTEEQVKECFKDNPELLDFYLTSKNIKHENLKAGHSGALVGATENGIDTSNHLAELKELEKTYNVNITEDLYKEVNEYVQKHKDDLKISVEDFDKNFENAKTIAEKKVNNSNTNNFEVKDKKDDEKANELFQANLNALTAKKQEIINPTEEVPEFTVEKNEDAIVEIKKAEVVSPNIVKSKINARMFGLLSPGEIEYAVTNKLAEYHEIMKGVGEKLSEAGQATKTMFNNFVARISDVGLKTYYACLSTTAKLNTIHNLDSNKEKDRQVLDEIKKNSSSYMDYLFEAKENNGKKSLVFGLETA